MKFLSLSYNFWYFTEDWHEIWESVHNLNISYRQLLSLALQDVQFALMNVSQKIREWH